MQKLLEHIAATAELMGQQISPTAAAMMAKDLSAYPQPVAIKALELVRRESKGRFSLAAVIEKIGVLQPDGRPGADEAWAMIPRDEQLSVVMTEEMAEAYGIALPLLNEGDQIAARKSFLEAYTRIVERNKQAGVSVKWFPSLGRDPAMREQVLRDAVRLGRLPASQVAGLLPNNPPAALAIEDRREISAEQAAANVARLKALIGKSLAGKEVMA